MTDQELRELDAWIAEHVMRYKQNPDFRQFYDSPEHLNGVNKSQCYFTTDPAAAMQVLEKCCDSLALIIVQVGGEWTVSQITGKRTKASADTLPLAICLFAKQLFSK